MAGKVVGAAIGGVVLFLVAVIVVLGGGTVAVAQPPAGGCVVTAPVQGGGQKSATLTANQMAVARTIVSVGKGLSITERGTAIALGTAMQESTLNPDAVNGRSVGLFQQQGELYADVLRTDPADTSHAFYNQLTARVPHYSDPAAGTFAEIAQIVQASGAGASKYAAWESWATALANDLYGGTPPQGGSTDARPGGGEIQCRVGGGSGPIHVTVRGLTIDAPPESGVTGSWTFRSEKAATAAAAALSYLGTPYSWGGGSTTGPSAGSDGTVGFDCSGLTRYAWAQAGISLPRVSHDQQKMPNQQSFSAVEPGDLLFWGSPVHHVTLYLGPLGGTDLMVEAPTTGDVVKVSPVRPAGLLNTVVRPA